MPEIIYFTDVGEGIHEGTLVKLLVAKGDPIKEDQALCEIETDKAIVEIPSPKEGTVLETYAQAGARLKVGDPLIAIGQQGEKAPEPKAKNAEPPQPVAFATPSKTHPSVPFQKPAIATQPTPSRVSAPPSVRKLALDLKVDLNSVAGTGPGGRISEEDVRKAAEPQPASTRSVHVVAKAYGPEIRVPLTEMRRRISERMTQTHQVPHLTHVDEADVTELWRIREREKKISEEKGVKLTLLPFVVKAVSKALSEYPAFNASLDAEKGETVLKKYYHMGIAIDTPEGLMVAVVKNADKKSVFDIAKEIQVFSVLAKDRTIKLEDLQGGTFTITNIGSVGGIYATPLINPPEAAILGVMRMQVRPAYDGEGNIRPRNFLPLCLTFDHRLNDGAKAAAFVLEIRKHLENPEGMLVGDI